MKHWFWACMLMKALDNCTTYYAVHKYGHIIEANPLVSLSIQYWGIVVTIVLNFIIFLLLMIYTLKKLKRNIFIIVFTLLSFTVCWNFFNLLYGAKYVELF